MIKRFGLRANVAVSVGAAILLLVVGVALFADVLYPGNPWRMVARPNLPPFSPDYLLGTDMLGRDLAAAIVHGSRVTLYIAGAATVCALLVGTFIGAIAGYYGGWVDDLAMQLTELFQAIPSFLLTVILVAVFSPSMTSIAIAIALVSWSSVARLVRAEVMGLRTQDFVKAARVGGLSHSRILVGHILPNATAQIIVAASLTMATAILIESGISFLGLGDRDAVTWGFLIGAGRTVLRVNWWLSIFPGIAIFLTVLALNLLGDGLIQVLNPRSRATEEAR